MKKHYRHEDDCLNCGTLLEGKYCHNCGQENLQIKESFGHMVNHAVSDYFHFDHQFFHTLKPLLFKPGQLTNEYIAGRRMQYLHPVKMYIFISLVFFFLYFQNNKHEPIEVNKKPKTEKGLSYSFKNDLDKNLAEDKNLTPAQRKLIAGTIKGFVPQADTAKASKQAADTSKVKKKESDDDGGGMSMFGVNSKDSDTYDDYLLKQSKLPANERDNFLKRYLKKKAYLWKSQGKNGKEMFTESFNHNTPKMMFLLLPLFAVILRLAFLKNNKFYVEHLIYAIHLHCYFFLLFTITLLLRLILPGDWKEVNDWIGIFAFIYGTWYVYKSLRAVYQRSPGRTISKMIGIAFMNMIALVFCFMTLATITALTSV
ncbi:DUF3667 domain-containing protein [Inquilinus sp. KBS0705]|nr:DUF3667 domain-containing protein [Inquilinus sp. KBS0705]